MTDDELRGLVEPQPEPLPTDARAGEPVWPVLVRELRSAGFRDAARLGELRDEQGCRKYGVPLATWNGRAADADAVQEALDGLAYTRCALLKLEEVAAVVGAESEPTQLVTTLREALRSQRDTLLLLLDAWELARETTT